MSPEHSLVWQDHVELMGNVSVVQYFFIKVTFSFFNISTADDVIELQLLMKNCQNIVSKPFLGSKFFSQGMEFPPLRPLPPDGDLKITLPPSAFYSAGAHGP